MARKKLLLVDDLPENLQLLYQTLKREYEIYSTTSGAEAIHLARRVRPDLILLDVMMPEMDGFEVCAALKADATLKEIPVIFLTALHDEMDELRGFEAGAVDYITKPFKTVIVKRRVATHLELQEQKRLLVASQQELQGALDRIRVLSGLVPICMTCKKIRDEQGRWNQLEVYITEHSDALFSHGLCPECSAKMNREIMGSDTPSRGEK